MILLFFCSINKFEFFNLTGGRVRAAPAGRPLPRPTRRPPRPSGDPSHKVKSKYLTCSILSKITKKIWYYFEHFAYSQVLRAERLHQHRATRCTRRTCRASRPSWGRRTNHPTSPVNPPLLPSSRSVGRYTVHIYKVSLDTFSESSPKPALAYTRPEGSLAGTPLELSENSSQNLLNEVFCHLVVS